MDLKELYKNLYLLSEYDKKPVKSRLNEELKEKFLTANQWLEKGFKPKENSFIYEMHPSSLNKKLCEYFYIDDVEPVFLETCAFCCYYKNRFCTINCYHVSVNNKCSEFEKRKLK